MGVIAAVLKDVQAACKAAKLQKFEIPTKVVLIDDLWTPENDMLTAVMKLKRKDILSSTRLRLTRFMSEQTPDPILFCHGRVRTTMQKSRAHLLPEGPSRGLGCYVNDPADSLT